MSSISTGISDSGFCNAGISIVGNPSVDPNVINNKFFALTAKICGIACRSFECSIFSFE